MHWRPAHYTRVLGLLVLLLALASPAVAGELARCTTYHELTFNRWQTLCADGTRAITTWNRTLSRWETTVTAPPGHACHGRFNPKTRQWVGRCR